jgi:hypothetical protein
MVEQAARYLFRKCNPSSSDAKVDEHWRVFEDYARWAIEAMREPTEEMANAVSFHAGRYAAEVRINGTWSIVDLHRSHEVETGLTDPDVAHDRADNLGACEAIRAMIDAALGEK